MQQEDNRMDRGRGLILVSALLALSVSSVDGFVTVGQSSSQRIRPPSRYDYIYESPLVRRSDLSFVLCETANQDDFDTSRRRESPLKVRRRVRAVLKKAKTGIQKNRNSIRTKQTARSVVADAASIGGLGGVVVDQLGTVDVALEMVKKNGETAPVKDPASTPSPVIKTYDRPEDDIVIAESVDMISRNGVQVVHTPEVKPKSRKAQSEVDAIKADIPAAYSEPLPFTLPTLSADQKNRLRDGERIQEQSKMGREGSGYVVLDIKAPPYVVWECLLDFESYPQTIPTVRDVRFFSSNKLESGYQAEKPIDPNTGRELRHYGTPSTTRAAFCLSKFRLNIAAIHNYRPHPDGDYMIFTLDPECTNAILQSAKGIWHTQRNPDGRGEEWVRVWLLCEVKVTSLLPTFIVEYTAKRAMPRATTWLKPQVEAAAKLWLKNQES